MRDAGTQVDMTHEYVSRRRLAPGETARLGKEIYEREIRHRVEPEHIGRVVAIDVDSGCWALGDDRTIPDEDVAVGRLRAKQPDAVNILCERAGYHALRSFGAGSLRRTD